MNDLQLQGEITTISEVQTGTSKKGTEWKKLGFVLNTKGEFPKDIYFTVFGEEKVDSFMKYNKVGQMVEVSFNIQSREYNEKWYTDLSAWKMFTLKEEATVATSESGKDDLPF